MRRNCMRTHAFDVLSPYAKQRRDRRCTPQALSLCLSPHGLVYVSPCFSSMRTHAFYTSDTWFYNIVLMLSGMRTYVKKLKDTFL